MPEPQSPRPDARPVPDTRGRRILVVEDDFLIAQDLQRALEALGAVVLGPVPRVADALAMLEGEAVQPDAATLDVNLDGEMVYPLADDLRARGVPFLFVTGYDAGSIPRDYAEVPVCEKPGDVGPCLGQLWRS